MMGSRAVGKTSIMASIFAETKENVAGTGLYFRSSDESSKQLIEKRLDLMEIFNKKDDASNTPQVGVVDASPIESKFVFEIGVTGKNKSANIEITDFPGEYLESDQNKVAGYIEESQIVMIAIDTPYLMESDGKYNKDKNKVELVTKFITNHTNEIKNKLILLMPLKSERYFHDERMQEVCDRVKQVYKELIEFCKGNNIACAVTPIQTLGGVEFDRFVDNQTGYPGIAVLPQYRFYGDDPKYIPLYCVQPMYYMMTYVANYHEWQQNNPSSVLDGLKHRIFKFLSNDKAFFNEIRKMAAYLCTNETIGYSVVQGNSIFKI